MLPSVGVAPLQVINNSQVQPEFFIAYQNFSHICEILRQLTSGHLKRRALCPILVSVVLLLRDFVIMICGLHAPQATQNQSPKELQYHQTYTSSLKL